MQSLHFQSDANPFSYILTFVFSLGTDASVIRLFYCEEQ